MSLSNLINATAHEKQAFAEIDKQKIIDNLPQYQRIIAYWRRYPDKFVDYLCSLNPDNKFKFYTVQRLYLRLCLRYRTLYAVFSRGFSKSFLAVLSLMIKAVLYPGAKLITVAEGKAQSASILLSKATEICALIPALAKEIEWDTRGKIQQTSQTKDSVQFSFKNSSTISNLPMTESSRGQRAQSVLTEEVATIKDQAKYEEIVAPMLVVSRKINGEVDPNEALNQSAIYVTSAGLTFKLSFIKFLNCWKLQVSSWTISSQNNYI